MLHAIYVTIKLMLLLFSTQGCLDNDQKQSLQITEISLTITDEMAGENITNTTMVLEEAVVQIADSSSFNDTVLTDVSAASSEAEQPSEDYNPSLFEFNAIASIYCGGTICTDKILNGRALISIDVKRLYAEMNNLDAADNASNYRLTGSMRSAAANDRLSYLAEANLVFSYGGGDIALDSDASLYINTGLAEQGQLTGSFTASDNETGLKFAGDLAGEP